MDSFDPALRRVGLCLSVSLERDVLPAGKCNVVQWLVRCENPENSNA